MNPSLKKWLAIAGRPSRTIIGLMSGTSLDGLDIALCNISGSGTETDAAVEFFATVPYSDYHKSHLQKVVSKEQVSLRELCWQHTWLGVTHADMILAQLGEWGVDPGDVDCIASHGQTVYHFPAHEQRDYPGRFSATLQMGDGDQIAARTGILTISDFRQKHTAHGGEGAPLAALVDPLLFAADDETRILLNIGGMANYSILLPGRELEGPAPFTTDTGPGNTLIDAACRTHFQHPYDRDGQIAASAAVHEPLLDALLGDPFFAQDGSKTTGPERFHLQWAEERASSAGLTLSAISPEQQIATYTELTARTIADSVHRHATDRDLVRAYISGGGAHNPELMRRIRHHLAPIESAGLSELGIDPDAKEALLMAVLANECLAGEGFPFGSSNGESRLIRPGKISFPD
ncbi:MAG: anhydro-N-acetylmuramic acid kinase [Balneolaceae bacterium]